MTEPSNTPRHLPDDTLSAHADGALDRAERVEADEHLRGCATCAARLDGMRSARAALRDTADEPVDELTRRRMIAAAIEGRGRASRPGVGVLERRRRFLAVAAVAAVALGAVALVASRTGTEQVARDAASGPLGLPIGGDRIAGVGALDDPAILRDALQSASPMSGFMVQSDGSADGGPTNGGGAAPGSPQSGGGPAGDDLDDESSEAPAPDGQGDRAVAGSAPAPEAATGTLTRRAATRDELAAVARCYDAVKSSLPRGNDLIGALLGTYQGDDVVALGFTSRDGRLFAMILDRDDCSIVSAQSFG